MFLKFRVDRGIYREDVECKLSGDTTMTLNLFVINIRLFK